MSNPEQNYQDEPDELAEWMAGAWDAEPPEPEADDDRLKDYANHLLARIAAGEEQIRVERALYEAAVARFAAHRDRRIAPAEERIADAARQLDQIARQLHERSGRKAVTWNLAGGQIRLRPPKWSLVVDDEKTAVTALRQAIAGDPSLEDLVRVKHEPAKTKIMERIDGKAFDRKELCGHEGAYIEEDHEAGRVFRRCPGCDAETYVDMGGDSDWTPPAFDPPAVAGANPETVYEKVVLAGEILPGMHRRQHDGKVFGYSV